MPDTIMITGGAGFLGGHLAVRLHQLGCKVVVFDLRPPAPDGEIAWLWRRENCEPIFQAGDVSDFASVRRCCEAFGVHGVVHTAVINNLDILANNVPLSLQVNTGGTVNVLEAARLIGFKKVVYASSMSVYAPVQYQPVDEAHPVLLPDEMPTLLSYSGTKLASEALGMHYWGTHGLDFVALRLSAIYGLGMVYPMYVKPAVENAVLGKDTHFDWGGDARRDYTYVADVVQGIVLALQNNPKSRIFNISHGGAMRKASELTSIIASLRPGVTVSFGNEVNEVEERTVRTRGMLSIERARSELGFQPQYPLEQGVAAYYRDYLAYAQRQ